MQNMARYMDALIIGAQQEKENTERERKRADAETKRADEAELTIQALQKEIEELKRKKS